MIETIKTWLKKPYYFNDSNQFKITMSLGIGLFIFLFLILLKPAGIELLEVNPYLFKSVYGLITTSVLLVYFYIIAKIFSNYYSDETWTIGKQIGNVLGILLICGLLNWLYTVSILTAEHYKAKTSFLRIVGYSITIGMLPTLIYTYFDERYHHKKFNNLTFKQQNKTIKYPNNEEITLYALNNVDRLTFKLNDLVYITSEANYACFYLKNGAHLKEYILRVTLQKIQEDLKEYKQLFRCHKSYIINTKYIQKINGNARGYNLQIRNSKKVFPISRKISKEELQKKLVN